MRRPLSRGEHLSRACAPARRVLARRAGVFAVLLGCGSAEPPADLGDHERSPGDGCGDLASECVDEATLWACVDRRWELVDCAETCEDRGGLVGCLTDPELPTEARCWCGDDMAACVPGQSECVSDDVVRMCDPETLEFVESTCDAVCAAREPPQRARGPCLGISECDCTLAGTPCAPGSPPRCNLLSVARCVDGVWDLESCPCSCDSWAPGGAACGC